MKIKPLVVATIKGSLWATVGYASLTFGDTVKRFGWEIVRFKPEFNPLVLVGFGLVAAGEILQAATVVPAIGLLANGIDAAGAIVDRRNEE